jgi:hypothetical protein
VNIEKNMIDGTKNNLYTFRGKTFECDAWTIQQLNLALAYNQSKERYEEVKPSTATKSRKRKESN